jgi:pullulanase
MPTAPSAGRIPPASLPLLLSLALLSPACKSSSTSETPPGPPASATLTLHYHRPLADYAGWTVETTVGAVESSVASSASDGFGAVYKLTLKSGAAAVAFSLKNGAATDPAGALGVDVSGTVREAWVFSGFAKALASRPPAIPASASQAALYYLRADGAYTGWGLHLWGDQAAGTVWAAPLLPAGNDPDLGAGFLFDLPKTSAAGNCPPGHVCFIVHKADVKDPGPDITAWTTATYGNIVFVTSGLADIFTAPHQPGAIAISGASAHLLSGDTVAWTADPSGATCTTDAGATQFELRYSDVADVKATATDITGGLTIALAPRAAGLTAAQKLLVPHLAAWCAYDIAPADLAKVQAALKGQLVAVARNSSATPVKGTQVQTALALDALYPYAGPLGVTFPASSPWAPGPPTFLLWAPTAQSVKLHVHDAAKVEVAGSPVTLSMASTGVWSTTGPAGWYGDYYRYELQAYHPATSKIETMLTTDPYAVNLSTNGLFAQAVDLADPSLAPTGWATLAKPALASPSDVVLVEGHLRDFSVFDQTVPAAHRGKLLAFTDQTSDGMKHLQALASAGVTHLHLLPAFDIATVDEDPASRVDLEALFDTLCARNPAVPTALCGQFTGKTILFALRSFAGDSDQQQAIAGYMRNLDSFNWGYDPFHYGAPEGSYASSAEGTAKIVEFRQMVQGLAASGLRTVMDVVYNHTNAAGPTSDKSVLDKVVPGYYHRLDPVTGYVLSSSCCSNTATEHRMMGRLMTDTLVRWARDYKVDGFRFDLMGLHLKADMLAAQAALAALTPGADGVDGSKIYLYGEGWDMGELAKNGRGVNANQVNTAGTGIGTFNDRLRDAARGGSPFDSGTAFRKNQGFSSGLFLDPNELGTATATDQAALADALDLIKIGMAGGLANFRLVRANTGAATWASAVAYNGAPAGYTASPSESINYVSSHDNQILWDIVQYKMPTGRSAADRVRAHLLAMDLVLLGQGVPFFHLGDDLLRSKSMEKNSYDSGDWFNRVDWTGQANGWRSGLPNAGEDQANWPVIRPIFADASAAPAAADIAAAKAHVQEMLRIRRSSPLFHLASGADVMKRVDFLNGGPSQVPGLIVMTLTDGSCAGADLDAGRDALVVIVNPDKAARSFGIAGAAGFTLHPIQQGSADPVVRTASFASAGGTGTFTVPARTTAVFEQIQAGAQGPGLPCNTR